MSKLSFRQQQIMAFIREYHLDHAYAPSVRDIQSGCSLSSTSVVDYNLQILQREGYIRRSPDVSRGLEILGDETGPVASSFAAVPLVGTIAAGSPLPVFADEVEASETIALPPELLPRNTGRLFALRVRGLSMIDALIDDGDIVVLRVPTEVRDGDMVAAWLKLEQEATLKHIYRQGNQVRLQPANSQLAPIFTPADNVEVRGKVVAVLRNLE
jgi:repressor LexA